MASRVSRSPRQPLRPRPCPTGGPEEQWQRAIHERGEAVCPTCSVVTRKTLVGLKKHMEVCQKVRLPPGDGREWRFLEASFSRAGPCLQLQDALKCQHCRKQFKSKAGLNYHTMAEHSAKVCRGPRRGRPWPLSPPPGPRPAPCPASMADLSEA